MDEPALSEQESAVLLAAARAGDDSALWRLTNDLRPYLKAVVGNLVDDRLAAKVNESDVVQQALVAAVQQFKSFDGSTLPEWKGWLAAIARNEAKNAVRFWQQQRRQATRENAVEFGTGHYQPADDASRASQQVSRREEAAELLHAIQQLSPSDQQLIQWRNFDGLSHGEIADRLQISEAAVRQRWVAALDRLRSALEVPGGS